MNEADNEAHELHPKRRWRWPRFSIPVLMYWMACLAVGAAASRNMFGLLAFTSCGVIGALIQPLGRTHGVNRLFRCVLAASLAFCIFGSLVINPWTEDSGFVIYCRGLEVTSWFGIRGELSQAWSVLLIVATDWVLLGLGAPRKGLASDARAYTLAKDGWKLFAAAFAMGFLAAETNVILHLVQVVVDQVYDAADIRFRRQGVYPTHSEEGYAVFWASFAAIAIAIGTLMAIRKVSISTGASRSRRLVTALCGLLFTGAYAAWFFAIEQYRSAPDLAESGWRIPPAALLMAIITCSILSIWLASRWTMRPEAIHGCRETELSTGMHLSKSPMIIAVVGIFLLSIIGVCGVAVGLWEIHTGSFAPVNFPPLYQALYPLGQVEFYVSVALGVLTIRMLSQLRGPLVWREQTVSPTSFWKTWLLLSAWFLVAVSALTAAGFCLWLGPWWSWA